MAGEDVHERLRKKAFEEQLEHQRREEFFKLQHQKKPSKKKLLILGLVVAALVLGSLTVISLTTGPGYYDDFAKCLTDKGIVIYGNDFCSYTQRQKTFFGKSFKQLNYVRCADDLNLCKEKGILVTPTWELNGQFFPEVQTFDALSAITGCSVE